MGIIDEYLTRRMDRIEAALRQFIESHGLTPTADDLLDRLKCQIRANEETYLFDGVPILLVRTVPEGTMITKGW